MDTTPKEGDRVTVPFNVGGVTEDAPGTVTLVRAPDSKTVVKVKLDEHGQEEVEEAALLAPLVKAIKHSTSGPG